MKNKHFDEVIEKIENTSKKVDVIMRNRLIIASFLIIDGINFILNPTRTISDMARFVALFVFIASATAIITNISAKKKDLKSIIISSISIVISILIFIFPKAMALYLRIILSLFIIVNGLINIFNVLKLDKASSYIINIENKIREIVEKRRIEDNFEKGIKEQTKRVIRPLNEFMDITEKISYSYLYLGINVIAIILGVLLLIWSNITIVIWGIIFLFIGISDFLMAAKSMNVSKKIKEKDIKSILYDENMEEVK